jgi:hypothetical protein
MINGDLVVVAKLAEELSVVRDGMVKAAGNLHGLALLLLDQALDMLLSLGNVLRSTSNLDASLAIALARDIDGNGELGLQLTLRLTATANERSVLVDGDIHNLGDLALALGNDFLDALDDLLDDISAAFHLDAVAIGILLGELDGTGELATIVRSAGTDHNLSQSRT